MAVVQAAIQIKAMPNCRKQINMQDEKPNELPAEPRPPNLIKLRKRKSPEDYWEGYKDGLKAARDGIDRSLQHFDDLMIARVQENGNN
jgi:hypothetical protein